LTSSTGNRETPEQPMLPTPKELAHWLLAYEIGEKTSSEEFVAAGDRAYLRLRKRLAVLLGSTGFDALWARALHLAQREFYSEDGTVLVESSLTHTNGLSAVVHGYDTAVIPHNLEVTFASFISLLFTFIGTELGLRFIRQLWPDLPPHAAESPSERTIS